MKEFYLVDLYNQAAFLPMSVRSWSPARFRSWLQIYGEVQEHPNVPHHFYFRAWSGVEGSFSFEDDAFLFWGDNCRIVLWKHEVIAATTMG